MAYIKVEVGHTIKNGSKVSFRAPCDCNKVVGLKVYFPTDNGVRTYQTFLFTDAHGNNLTGIGHLFAEGAIVKAILSPDTSRAYLQNADTNKYLEGKFTEMQNSIAGRAPASHGNHVPATETANKARFLRNDNTWQTVTPADIGAAPAYTYGKTDLVEGVSTLGPGKLHFVYGL